MTLSPPSIVRYVTGRRVACRALRRSGSRVMECSSVRRKNGAPNAFQVCAVPRAHGGFWGPARQAPVGFAVLDALTPKRLRGQRAAGCGDRRRRLLRTPSRTAEPKVRAVCDPARPKKEGRRSGPKSREETPTWAATEKTRRGTGSRQTVRPASTTFKFRDPLTRQPRCSFPLRLAPRRKYDHDLSR